MGTPDFAVPSLEILLKNGFDIVAVVTVPDKNVGRGQKIQASPVKKFAVENGLRVLQPEKLKNPDFIDELKSLDADLFVVVAFRMLPDVVWSMPPCGTFNLHSSLLPQYRGAAPINHAVINGEKETGVTTFFINKDIDTGNIIHQEKVAIGDDENAGSLHDRLMVVGAQLVLKTANEILSGNVKTIPQNELIDENIRIKPAPKIFRENCKIDWNANVFTILNFIRGLSPYPAAWSEIKHKTTGEVLSVKFFEVKICNELDTHMPVGSFVTDGKTQLSVACLGGGIQVMSLQLQGKKQMDVGAFLRGFPICDYCLV